LEEDRGSSSILLFPLFHLFQERRESRREYETESRHRDGEIQGREKAAGDLSEILGRQKRENGTGLNPVAGELGFARRNGKEGS
jgi:hypothetical protein